MINEEANKSWAIRTYTDELLNLYYIYWMYV